MGYKTAEERRAYQKLYYEKHKETWNSKYKADPTPVLEKKRLDRLNNPEKYKARDKENYAKHRDKKINSVLAWAKANPAKKCANVRKREAAKLQRTPKWLSALQLDHILMFYEAAAQLSKELGIKMSVDHIVPLQGKNVSGLHVPWNIQVLPLSENIKKHNSFGGY